MAFTKISALREASCCCTLLVRENIRSMYFAASPRHNLVLFAVALEHVFRVDADAGHPDQDVARARLGIRHILIFHHFRTAVRGHHRRLHVSRRLAVSEARLALADFYDVSIRIANVAARLAVLFLWLCDKLGSSTSP